MCPGSIPTNIHEGSRSEYLAQYVFTAFGTASAVEHQEDHGIDLYCTLMDRVGHSSWPRAYYTVQVKSTHDAWEFEGAESVNWLLNHPLPLFLCVVSKKDARLQVFTTLARFSVAFPAQLPRIVRLRPGPLEEGSTVIQSGDAWEVPLRHAILNATIEELLTDDCRSLWHSVLMDWAKLDEQAIRKHRNGILSATWPTYETNTRPSRRTFGTTSAGLDEATALPQLLEFLEDVCGAYQFEDPSDETTTTEALLCMLHRRLSGTSRLGGQMMFSHNKLNATTKMDHPFAAADHLVDMVHRTLHERR
jgi:hypothetical protein